MKSTIMSEVLDRWGSTVATLRADGGVNIFASLDEYEGGQIIPTQQVGLTYEGVTKLIKAVLKQAMVDNDRSRIKNILGDFGREELAELLLRSTYKIDIDGKLELDDDGKPQYVDDNMWTRLITVHNIDSEVESIWIHGGKKSDVEESGDE